jgi:cytochrome c oxidase subunit 2
VPGKGYVLDMRAAARRLVVPVLVVLALTACDTTFGQKSGVTKQSHGMSDLWRAGMIAAIIVGSLVVSLTVWCMVRYRRRGRDDVPDQRQYHIPLEIAYTAIPVVIVLVFFGFSWAVQNNVDALKAHPDVTVDVQGFQWQWRFHYREANVTVVGVPDKTPVMVVPVGKTIRLVLTSHDVIHSFYVPQFLFKRDVVPGLTNRFDITPDTTGTFRGYCAEFCGLDHARMTFAVRVLSPADYRSWIARHRGAA